MSEDWERLTERHKAALMAEPGNGEAAREMRRLLLEHGRLEIVGGDRGGSGDAPRVLVAAAESEWLSVARLPASLERAGFAVAVACPRRSFLARSGLARERYFLEGATYYASIGDAVAAFDPTLIVAGDEPMVHLLHFFARREPSPPARLRDLIRRSCGDPLFYAAVKDKVRISEIAAALGIRTPGTLAGGDEAAFIAFAAAHGYPVVVKAAHGTSGATVRLCRDAGEIEAAVAEFTRVNRELPPFLAFSRLMVQSFVVGEPVSIAFAAHEGKVLESFVYRAERVLREHGPASVIALIDHPEITAATRRLAAHCGITGFAGLDFMVEAATGLPYFLECNPRVTGCTHLGAALGHDLAGALYEALAGRVPEAPLERTPRALVALFPQEWHRDRNSRYLRDAHVDVPWEDPDLLAAFINGLGR